MTEICSVHILQWLKDFVPIVASVAVIVVTISFNRWQRRLEREKLRHSLYDRRMAVYICFRELLLGLLGKTDDELQALYQKSFIASQEVSFLFEEKGDLKTYLEELCDRILKEVIQNIDYFEGVKQFQNPTDITVEIRKELIERTEVFGASKLKIHNEHLQKLPEKFAPFLRLTDSPK